MTYIKMELASGTWISGDGRGKIEADSLKLATWRLGHGIDHHLKGSMKAAT